MGCQIAVEVILTEVNCGVCGGTYAINERYREKKYETGGSWTCPYCECSWGYSDNNENSKLKKEKERLERRLEFEKNRRETAEKSLSAQKGVNTKLKKRASAGICPCCNRHFKQLSAHMKNKHPDFTNE